MDYDVLRPGPALLGRIRRTRLPLGSVTGRAAGSAGYPDLMVDSDDRGMPAAYPGHGAGGRNYGSTSFGGLRYPEQQQAGAFPSGIGGPGGAYGGGWSDGVLTVRDRHVMTQRGTTRYSARENDSALPNPQHDGPPMRQFRMIDTTESWQIGTDNTMNQDNNGVHNAVDAGGRRYPLGTQDGSLTRVMGPPLGEWREYGVRGPRGMHGPEPDIWDPNWVPARGAGGGGGRGRLEQKGADGMQAEDARFVYGGEPHGLHSPTISSLIVTQARQASIPQMVPPRLDRPASSRIAGQSYSQTIVPEAQQGQVRQMPRMADPGRMPGLNDRFRGRT